MSFELLCVTLIALLLGTAVCFGGYRLFLFLLPIWGFLFGFTLGAQIVQGIFDTTFLATTTSWVVGFFVAVFFAGLSYLFYAAAIGVLAGSLGYGLGLAIMGMFNANLTFITLGVSLTLAIIAIGVTFRFNLAKYVIIVGTAVVGASLTIITLVAGVGAAPMLRLIENPMRTMLDDSPFWMLLLLLMAAAGIALQIQINQAYEIEAYDRWNAFLDK